MAAQEPALAFVVAVNGDNDPSPSLETLPGEVLLHILSYLDLPELDALSRISPLLHASAYDPGLHRSRLRIVTPSRVSHALFGADATGVTLRPSVPELVQRCVLRGLGLERRWRAGQYFNSRESVKQYETSQRLQRSHVQAVIAHHLRNKSPATAARAFPDIYAETPVSPRSPTAKMASSPSTTKAKERSSRSQRQTFPTRIAPRLLPTIRNLKWSIRRDALARTMRDRAGGAGGVDALLRWHGLWKEDERVRLAICPGVGKFVRYFESLATN